MTDLHTKKKIIVDNSAAMPFRRVTDLNNPNIKNDFKVEFYEGVYLRTGHNNVHDYGAAPSDVDWLRGALGKGFEFRKKSAEENHKIYANDWAPINIFYQHPLDYEAPTDGSGDCYFVSETLSTSSFGLANTRIKQKIIIKCVVPFTVLGANDTTEFQAKLKKWTVLMKTGFKDTETNQALYPLIKNHSWFYDHHHDTLSPFSEKELLSKTPVGKAFYVKFKSYYNEVMSANRSALYENYISNKTRLHNSLPNIYAFAKLMDQSAAMLSGIFDLAELRKYIQTYLVYGTTSAGRSASAILNLVGTGTNAAELAADMLDRAPPETYKHLLRLYPLETMATLYGIIGANEGVYTPLGVLDVQGLEMLKPSPGYSYPTKIIEKIITLNPDKTDMTGLIRSYIKEWMNALQYEGTAKYLGTDFLRTEEQFVLRLGALENIGYNLIFSPNMMQFLNKVNKIKNHFPMYNHIEFSTSTSTAIGDFMKKFLITKFMATQIAASQDHFPYAKWYSHHPLAETWGPDQGPPYFQNYMGIGDIIDLPVAGALPGEQDRWTTKGAASLSNVQNFVDYEETTEYAVTDTWSYAGGQPSQSTKVLTKRIGDNLPTAVKKTCIEFPVAIEKWVGNEDYESMNEQYHTKYTNRPWAARDVRNFITYIDKSGDDQVSLSGDDNPVWKTLIGSVFYAKLADTYDKHKRTYADILNGVKAYTEDLFYKIEKHVKHYNTGEEVTLPQGQDAAGWKIVQNIIIPNTSDVNIAEHIDTQVKYGKDVAYKYKVYVYRVVFGSRYKYEWGTVEGTGAEATFFAQGDLFGTDLDGSAISYSNLEDAAGGVNEFFVGTAYIADDADAPTDITFTASPVVTLEPSIKIMADEVYTTDEIRILDRPPVAPYVNIVPYRAVKNRIKIMLAGSSDRYRQEPVLMLDSDLEEFNFIKDAQFSLDGKVEFGSDDVIKNFQVFRVEEKPKAYSDFQLHPSKPFIFGGSGTLEEKILPNTKYYYTFRAIDSHGHVSNPTPVYEVELINEKGAIKPLIRTVSFEQKKENLTIKECQKYIYIKPSTKQMYFSDQPDVDSVFTTADNSGIKKKKYKMRITSKGSGKKIDVNFSYIKKIIAD